MAFLSVTLLLVPVLPGILFRNEKRMVDHTRSNLNNPGCWLPGKDPPMRSLYD